MVRFRLSTLDRAVHCPALGLQEQFGRLPHGCVVQPIEAVNLKLLDQGPHGLGKQGHTCVQVSNTPVQDRYPRLAKPGRDLPRHGCPPYPTAEPETTVSRSVTAVVHTTWARSQSARETASSSIS